MAPISRFRALSAAFLLLGTLLSPAFGAAANLPSDDKAQPAKPAVPSKPKISSLSPAVSDAARKIDDLVAANYGDLKATRLTNDDEFLRRAYLDITGAIPSYEQAKAFLDSRDANKRQKLIDDLLDSPGYVSHMYNYWADLLRINNRTRGDYAGNYPQWVKEQIKNNLPFDMFVYELITAEGKAKDNGAVGYWLRDDGMVLEITSTTAQVFLGTQIGCAQCHDHPFDSWEQKQFYELAAFTSQVTTRDGARGNPAMREVRKKITAGELPKDVQQVVQNLVREASYGVADQQRKNLKLPNDYKYDNGKPGQVVSAHVIFGQEPAPARDLTSRERYARWLTSPNNPLFTQVIANRLWAKVFGIGIVNPVDDFGANNKPLNPALLAHLTQTMKTLRYDMKEFLRIVLNTKAYQLATNREDYTKENFKHQAGVLRRMTAEQVWDSFITLMVEDPNAHIGEDGYGPGGGMMAMMMGGGDVDVSKMTADEIIKYAEKIIEQRKEGRRDMIKGAMQARRGGGGPGMARASEIRQPAPAGHFLREFGGSGRETVSDAHTDPSVPQVLYLLNGPSFGQIIARNSELMKNLARASDDKAKVETLYLSILSRYPSPTELAVAIKEVKANAAKGVENVTWALINTREFIFIR
jgi:hypothetical protein